MIKKVARTPIEECRDRQAEAHLPTWSSLTDEQMLDRIPRVAALADQVGPTCVPRSRNVADTE